MRKSDLEQDAAINATESKVLVVAGAGSGKTYVLTERIKKLLSEGVNPNSIIAITYTNIAAEEMTSRLGNAAEGMFVGTVHSFANRILRSSNRAYHILDDKLDDLYHSQVISQFCKYLTIDRYLEYKNLRNASRYTTEVKKSEVENFLTSEEKMELTYIESDQSINTAYPWTVNMLLKYNNIITFDELIVLTTEYLKSHQIKLSHVLVDEFQDIASLEYDFIRALNADNYYFVGDDWQSIYGWKGGNVKIFTGLAKNPDWTRYNLSTNYRCSKAVVNYGNYVISRVESKLSKNIKLPSDAASGSIHHGSTQDLTNWIGRIKRSTNYKDWFILARTNKEVFYLQEKLRAYMVPFVTFKREGI